MSSKRRQFTREFKLEALRLVEESGKSIGQVARDLGIHETMLRRWRDRAIVEGLGKSATDLFPGNGKLPSQDEEIRRLRRELEMVRQERDFLKKAAAYFAKESR
jgi:transposase